MATITIKLEDLDTGIDVDITVEGQDEKDEASPAVKLASLMMGAADHIMKSHGFAVERSDE